jgi:outer membrane receptor protein involved in Fe transport
VHLALLSSATAATGMYAPTALSEELSEVVVTGSRIRRVDAETASPVFTMSRDVIDQSGVTSLGQLVQQIPSISGAATNTTVNNGGGDGASTIELRGLGDERTLVLLNGRRMSGIAGNGAVDINIFPVNLIERVDVLKEGASAIYGTDAIGGVVNFITRTDFDGLELSYDYGVTSESDGRRDGVGIAWGTTGDRGSVVIGANYNKQEEVSAGDRAFSEFALYLYGVYGVTAGGSSRTPNGRIRLPANHPLHVNNGGTLNCGIGGGVFSVTKLPGVDGTDQADYRCFGGQDFYNYQPLNLLMTPQERGSLFISANYNVSENLEVYTEFLNNYTTSGFQIAELPFDSRDDDIVIPANNFYNPFGIAFGGGDGVNPDAEWRMQGLGTRHNSVDTTTYQATLGVRGAIMDSGWDWDANAAYSRIDQDNSVDGYLLSSKLQGALGPSFDAGGGNIVCGTPGNIVPNCIPVNIFDANSPAQAAALDTIAASYNQTTLQAVTSLGVNVTGSLFDMPAGEMQIALGAGYDDYAFKFETDALTDAQPPDFLNCGLAQETCSSDTRGGYDVNSLYFEGLVPLLKDAPGATALNLIVGTRYSDFSTFGSTTDSSVKIEWRPFSDLLVRGTFAEVFRSPTVSDLFAGQFANAPTFNDPCIGLTAAQVAANPNLALACENVPQDGSFVQPNSQITGLLAGNQNLQPETGDVLTAGFVYQPSALGGFSVTFDWWRYELDDVITAVDVNTTAEICVDVGDPTFCNFIERFPDGTIQVIHQPTFNLGTLETSGYDIGLRYALADTASGSWQFAIDMTYIDKFDSTPCAVCSTTEVAGTFDRQYGNYAEWRGLASVGWGMEPFNALLSARYVGSLVLHDPDGAPGIQPDLSVGAVTYLDLTLGYAFKDNLKISVGVDNITDEDPPLLFQNNVINANTDVITYLLLGTIYRAGIKYTF